jgi:hypothetical protein
MKRLIFAILILLIAASSEPTYKSRKSSFGALRISIFPEEAAKLQKK